MQLEKETKIKIIIGAVAAILVLILAGVVMSLFSSDEKPAQDKNVSLLSGSQNDFTLDDMMNMNEQSKNESGKSVLSERNETAFLSESKSGIYEEESEEVKRLQEALRSTGNDEKREPEYTYVKPIESSKNPTKTSNPVVSPIVAQENKVTPTATKTESAPPLPVEEKTTSRFFRGERPKETGNAVLAVTFREQIVSNGSTVRMRLLDDLVTKEGVIIPAHTEISGVVKLGKERAELELQSVRLNKNIYTIKKVIYDKDGIKGINIPESTKAEIAKNAKSAAIQSTETRQEGTGFVNTTTNAVTEATKSVLSRKEQEVKFTLKSNYQFYLK